MTREEIIKALEEGITSWGMYQVNYDVMDEINVSEDPFSYVKPILELIGAHPDIDFGAPGELVHFVEKFNNMGYEELLIESVRKSPTAHNIWMVHRCFNDENNPMHDEFVKLIQELKENSEVSEAIKNEIDSYTW